MISLICITFSISIYQAKYKIMCPFNRFTALRSSKNIKIGFPHFPKNFEKLVLIDTLILLIIITKLSENYSMNYKIIVFV